MKKVILWAMCIFLHVIVCAQGIHFDSISVKEALEKAQKERKMVFVDMWATWCVPCKMLAETLFSQKEVGEYMNSRFICVKCDIDTQEGKILKKRYGVNRVPTLLILQPDGEVRCFMLGGSRQKGEFLEWASLGLNERSSLSYLENLVKTGEKMTKKNLNDYFLVLEARREFSDSVRLELFERLSMKERAKAKYWKLFRDQVGDNKYFHFVEDHIAEFRENVGREEIDDYLLRGFSRIVRKCAYEKVGDTRAVELIERTCDKLSGLTLKSYAENTNKSDCKILMLQAQLIKSYLIKDIQAMLRNMRVFVNMGKWWDCAWFPVLYIAKHGTRDEYLTLNQLGREVILNLANTREQWEYIQKFKELGFSIPCLEQIWTQVQSEARKQGKKILIEVVNPEDVSCREMNRRLSLQNMAHFVDSLCVNMRIDASSLDGMGFLYKRKIINSFCPAYWLLDSEGNIMHVWTGMYDDKGFRECLQDGLKEKKSYRYLKSCIERGEFSFDELIDYLDVLKGASMQKEYKRIYSDCFEALSDKDRVSERYWPFISRITCDMLEHNYIVSHYAEYEKNVGNVALQDYFITAFKQTLEQGIHILSTTKKVDVDFWIGMFEKIQMESRILNLQNVDTVLCMSNMALAYLRGNVESWLRFAIKSVNFQKYMEGSLLDVTMRLLENYAEKKHLPLIDSLCLEVRKKPNFMYINRFNEKIDIVLKRLRG